MDSYDLLKYIDEEDKSLGVAGMAIALFACDGQEYISAISIEDDEDSFGFAPEAFFGGNPRFSAKLAWLQLMKEFHIFSGLLLGNVFCRHIPVGKEVKKDIVDMVHDLIFEHGGDVCSLEEDEIESLFNKDLKYFHRLFAHPTVADVARDLAHNLRMQRHLTGGDVLDNLRRLSML